MGPRSDGQPSQSNPGEEAKLEIWERWRSQLTEEDARQPHRAVSAVLPNWEAWRDQGGVPLSFRTTQMLTGHGVLGEYLLKIGRVVTSTCHHCGEGEDTAQHALGAAPHTSSVGGNAARPAARYRREIDSGSSR
jgi:hypothetical protein